MAGTAHRPRPSSARAQHREHRREVLWELFGAFLLCLILFAVKEWFVEHTFAGRIFENATYEILQRLAEGFPQIRLFRHARNSGKGAAVRTAIEKATGDFSLIQDADLEYDPSEYPTLLRPLLDGHADAVFGSRYMAGSQTRVLLFWHSMINKFLTVVSDMFCNLNLTDMETCYKVFRTDLLKSIPIRSASVAPILSPSMAMAEARCQPTSRGRK